MCIRTTWSGTGVWVKIYCQTNRCSTTVYKLYRGVPIIGRSIKNTGISFLRTSSRNTITENTSLLDTCTHRRARGRVNNTYTHTHRRRKIATVSNVVRCCSRCCVAVQCRLCLCIRHIGYRINTSLRSRELNRSQQDQQHRKKWKFLHEIGFN